MQNPVKLSCEQCQQRKTKCNKAQPCGSCQRSNLECTVVQRRRLPRGRTAARTGKERDTELRAHVARLEGLVAHFTSNSAGCKDTFYTPTVTANGLQASPPSRSQSGKKVECGNREPFWSALNDQVVGIRETLEEEFPDEQNEKESITQNPSPFSQNFDIVLFGTSSCAINPSVTESPPESLTYALLSSYLQRIDPIFKVTHAPSLRTIILAETREPDHPMTSPALDALRFSVYFSSVCALTETECREKFNAEKNDLRDRFRLATEVMLSNAGLQTTKDFTVLQAFVIYLAGRRSCTGYRNVSLLVASAVRIAQNIGLDVEDSRTRNPFQLEMRRRLWYSMCVLDMQVAFDGGTRPTITHHGLLSRLPMRINDADLSPGFEESPMELRGFTDMSFSSMTNDALLCWRRLNHVSTDSEGRIKEVRQDWVQRAQIVTEFEQLLKDKYLQYCDTTQPFQVFTRYVGEGMMVTMRLLERRPVYGLLSNGPPALDDFNILKVATEVLEASLQKQTIQSLAPWSWFSWAKWYALAVALAELCGGSHGFQVDKAWTAVEASFPRILDLVVDDSLCRSLEKLLSKARSVRDSIGTPSSNLVSSVDQRANHFPAAMESKTPDIRLISPPEHLYSGEQQPLLQKVNYDSQASNSGNAMQELPTPDSNGIPSNHWMDEQEAMSWGNWEAFVQDVSDFNGSQMLDTTFWG